MELKYFTKATRSIDAAAQHAAQSPLKKHKRRFKTILILFSLLIACAAVGLWQVWELPVLSPLTTETTFRFLSGKLPDKKRVVYAYLPYWNLDNISQPPKEITHLAYFSLTIGPDGFIVTRGGEGDAEPGYNKLSSEKLAELAAAMEQQGGKTEIVLAQFNNDSIVSLLTTETARENLLTSLDSILLAVPINGINIDIEYTGEVTPQIRANLTKLVTAINQHLDAKYNHVQLSIAMYASAAEENQFWEVAAIGEQVDYIVIMAYDFHRRGSIQAGPVAPLYGANELWDGDINHYLKNFVAVVPRSKLLLGVPFYGYGWQTTNRDSQSTTYPDTGFTATYKYVQDLLARRKELQLKEQWEDTALSPFVTYIEDGETYVVHYEDPRSLRYKLEYVRQLDLAGIAIWALGYEGDNGDGSELWQVVAENM